MPVPAWFTTAFESGDSDESIIGYYHPTQSEAAALAVRQRLQVTTNLFGDDDEGNADDADDEDDAQDGEDANENDPGEGEHWAGIWQDSDASETSPWLTVDAGILIGQDGVLVAGFVPTPHVARATADAPLADTAGAFTVDAAFAEVRALQARAMALLDGDDTSANPSVVLAAIREARQCIALAARIAGILDGD